MEREKIVQWVRQVIEVHAHVDTADKNALCEEIMAIITTVSDAAFDRGVMQGQNTRDPN